MVSGELQTCGQCRPVTGAAWMDHERSGLWADQMGGEWPSPQRSDAWDRMLCQFCPGAAGGVVYWESAVTVDGALPGPPTG